MQDLYDNANSAKFKDLHYIETGDHNNNWHVDKAAYFLAIENFI